MRDQSVRLERLLLSNHEMQSDAKSVIKMKNDLIWDKNKGIRANDWRVLCGGWWLSPLLTTFCQLILMAWFVCGLRSSDLSQNAKSHLKNQRDFWTTFNEALVAKGATFFAVGWIFFFFQLNTSLQSRRICQWEIQNTLYTGYNKLFFLKISVLYKRIIKICNCSLILTWKAQILTWRYEKRRVWSWKRDEI